MSRLLMLFSHILTDEQVKDAKETFHIEEIRYLPDDLQVQWSGVDPGLETLLAYAEPFMKWIRQSAEAGDFVLVQGDFGLTVLMVDFCLRNGLTAIYATTERKAVSRKMEDGTIQTSRIFSHCRFRKYQKYQYDGQGSSEND